MARALLVIDMSIEQTRSISHRLRLISNIRRLANHGDFDLRLDSRLWIKDPSTTSLSKVYSEVGLAGTSGAKLLPELNDLQLSFVSKFHYSSFFNSGLTRLLRSANVTDLFLCGINTDFCVFKTALDAFELDFNVVVVSDACDSICGKEAHEYALRKLQQYLPVSSILNVSDIVP